MYREKINELLAWKQKEVRKPLILQGARQVGKTWLVKEFGQKYYRQCVYINFEKAKTVQDIFKADFDTERIIQSLQIYSKTEITPEDTLIFFDEIQAAENGLTSLKYFFEDAPQYHIIAAGSLLGMNLHKNVSFPVGKVNLMELRPMSFFEFLMEAGEALLVDALKANKWPTINSFHDKLTEYLRIYYFVGGMPESVQTYFSTKNFEEVRTVQNEIIGAYERDFSKHAPLEQITRIQMVWQSIPSQLAKENKKFVYGILREGSRAKDFEIAILWLCECGLLLKSHRITKPDMPLIGFQELSVFKLFLLDVGLLSALIGIDAQLLLEKNRIFLEYKGAFTEQFVMQELRLHENDYIGYWTNDKSTAEVDFIVQRNASIFPIEVKAEENLKAKSFKLFCEKFQPKSAYRTSMAPYREESWMTNIPLYAIGSEFD